MSSSQSLTLSPASRSERSSSLVDNPHFVTEEFHEKHYDNEEKKIIITDDTRETYEDLDYLVKKYHEEGWAKEPGILYTRKMTNCPSGKGPTSEILCNMNQIMHLKMYGKVVMDNGDVYDFDTQNELIEILEKQDHVTIQQLAGLFRTQMEFHTTESQLDITGFTLVPEQVINTNIPQGLYEKKKKTHKIRKDGIHGYSLCDNKRCCMAGHMHIMMCAMNAFPESECDKIMKFIRERTIYRHLDPIKGNFELCHYCAHGIGAVP